MDIARAGSLQAGVYFEMQIRGERGRRRQSTGKALFADLAISLLSSTLLTFSNILQMNLLDGKMSIKFALNSLSFIFIFMANFVLCLP